MTQSRAVSIYQPGTLEEAVKLASYISKSGLVPATFKGKEADTLVAMMWGEELGVSTMQALQNIAVINGKPSIYGDLAVGLMWASGLCAEFEEYIKGEGDARTAYCKSTRVGTTKEQVRTFSVADAKQAGLWGKQGPWTQYSDRMLQMRARGFLLRDLYADVMKGLITTEEAQDYPTKGAPIDVTPAPEQREVPVAQKEEAPKVEVETDNNAGSQAKTVSPEPTPESAPPQATSSVPDEMINKMKEAITKRRRYGWSVTKVEELFGKKFTEFTSAQLKEVGDALRECGTDEALVADYLAPATDLPQVKDADDPDIPSVDGPTNGDSPAFGKEMVIAEIDNLIKRGAEKGHDIQAELGIPPNWDSIKYDLDDSRLVSLRDDLKEYIG